MEIVCIVVSGVIRVLNDWKWLHTIPDKNKSFTTQYIQNSGIIERNRPQKFAKLYIF